MTHDEEPTLKGSSAPLANADDVLLAPATSHVAGEWQPPVARVDVACCLAADDELAATAEGWFVVRAAPSLEVEI